MLNRLVKVGAEGGERKFSVDMTVGLGTSFQEEGKFYTFIFDTTHIMTTNMFTDYTGKIITWHLDLRIEEHWRVRSRWTASEDRFRLTLTRRRWHLTRCGRGKGPLLCQESHSTPTACPPDPSSAPLFKQTHMNVKSQFTTGRN